MKGYTLKTGKFEATALGFGNREYRGKAEGPSRRGRAGMKDRAGLEFILGGFLVDPFKGEFGAYGQLGIFGLGAYVAYDCKD